MAVSEGVELARTGATVGEKAQCVQRFLAASRVHRIFTRIGPGKSVKLVANDNWSEATLSWNNRPAAGATLATSTPVINAWQDFDLLAGGTWNYGADLADNLLSLALTEGEALSSTVKQVWYSPAEQLTYPYQPAELVITWTKVPEPGSLWLFAIAALVCGFMVRRITIRRRSCSPYAQLIPHPSAALALS